MAWMHLASAELFGGLAEAISDFLKLLEVALDRVLLCLRQHGNQYRLGIASCQYLPVNIAEGR